MAEAPLYSGGSQFNRALLLEQRKQREEALRGYTLVSPDTKSPYRHSSAYQAAVAFDKAKSPEHSAKALYCRGLLQEVMGLKESSYESFDQVSAIIMVTEWRSANV